MSSMYKVIVPRNEYRDQDIARLNISVGQEYHEGDKFQAVCDWVSRHFNQSVVNICDSLQRHNLEATGIEPKQAHKMAIANGDAWIERNRQSIESLPNVQIIRWDDWRQGAYWDYALDKARKLYENDKKFQSICRDTAHSFISKRTFANEQDQKRALDYSTRYIMEEVAFSLVSSFDDVADIYPGTFPPIFDYMRENGIPSPVSMTKLSFKRRKHSPQAA
jgi:tRNA-dependent cyclodipeptide synthase